MTHSILIVDDESLQRQILAGFLKEHGYETIQASSGEEAWNQIQKGPCPDLVISDMKMNGMSGWDLLKRVNQQLKHLPFIMITAFGNIDDAVEIMKSGAVDYLTKPVNLSELLVKLEKAFDHQLIVEENANLRKELTERRIKEPIITKSPLMQQRLERARKAARTDIPVLITGASGTGKELFARTVHHLSPRHKGPFIPINCASLNPGVLESELFGHERGAFTGAQAARKGRFEMASNGTLFLDEVGDLPLDTQVKLLRVIQEGIIERVGGNQPVQVNFRLICATHRDLEQRIKDGLFREDLFYRINVVNIELPSLVERKEDIPLLLEYFIKSFSQKYQIPIQGFTREAFQILCNYDFPGNIRELINICQKAIVLSQTDVIQPEDIEGIAPLPETTAVSTAKRTLPDEVADLERVRILEALEAAGNVQVQAAFQLGINERTLRYKMEKYGILNQRSQNGHATEEF